MIATEAAKGSKEQYRVVVELDAPIATCFAAGTAEEAMLQWVPGPRSVVYDHSRASEPYGAGSERRVTLKSGISIVEKIEISQKPTFLAYSIPTFLAIPDLLLKGYRGHMHFEAIGEKKTRLIWIGYFDCAGLQRLSEPLTRILLKKMITTMANNMKTYLEHK